MAITRAALEQMDEAQLRTEVLIPLFTAMGFRDVIHYHGGVLEQGKDIVMWMPDPVGDRRNYAVVAKAGDISGQAKGAGSAGEVIMQVQQCLGSTYLDPMTLEAHPVDECYVVTSGEFKKEADTAILNAAKGAHIYGRVKLFDANRLWPLIEKFLPESAAVQKLAEAREAFESASDHHRIIASVSGDGLMLSTAPKHPDAYELEPLRYELKLSFPDTPSAQQALADLENHLKTGAPVSLPREVISEFTLPEFVRRFMPPATEDMRIDLGPRTIQRPLIADVVLEPDGAETVRIDRLDFRVLQAGTDEITLDNGQQPCPFHFTIRINFSEGKYHLNYETRSEGNALKQLLEIARVSRALASGGKFRLESAETGLSLGKAAYPRGLVEGLDDGSMALLEDAFFIQTQTGTPLWLPEEGVTLEDAKAIHEVSRIVRNGVIEGTSKEMEVTFHRAGAEAAAADPSGFANGVIRVVQNVSRTIFGAEISLGVAEVLVTGLGLTPAAAEDLARRLAADPDADGFDATLVPISGGSEAAVVMRFADWPAEGVRKEFVADATTGAAARPSRLGAGPAEEEAQRQ